MKISELVFLLNKFMFEEGDKDIYVRIAENEFANIFEVAHGVGEMDYKEIGFFYLSLQHYLDDSEEVLTWE